MQYGALGFALAFAALPIYIHLPNLYAREHGVSLAWLGGALLAMRLADAWTDLLWGRLADHLWPHPKHLAAVLVLAAAVLGLGMSLLFFPLPSWPRVSLLIGMTAATQAHSLLAVVHHAWGARWAGDAHWRSRVSSWREGWTTLGVVIAASLPLLLGWAAWLGALWLALALGLAAWWRSAAHHTTASGTAAHPGQGKVAPHEHNPTNAWWRQPALRLLLTVQACSALASAVAATLVLFVVQDVLQAPQAQAPLLLLYFAAAIAALPWWLARVPRWGLLRVWQLGHLRAMGVFLSALALGPDRSPLFALMSLGSGWALGADLAASTALLAGHIQHPNHQSQSAGVVGAWNMINKLALAAAAGLVLPWLAYWGYRPEDPEPGRMALGLTYALLPLALKGLGLIALRRYAARAARRTDDLDGEHQPERDPLSPGLQPHRSPARQQDSETRAAEVDPQPMPQSKDAHALPATTAPPQHHAHGDHPTLARSPHPLERPDHAS